MSIDERALQVATDRFLKSDTPMRIDHAFRKAIEAYEAARWQPIKEAKRDGSTVLIAQRSDGGWLYNAAYHIVIQRVDWWIGPGWKSTLEGLVGIGAMFRTIDPPKAAHATAKQECT